MRQCSLKEKYYSSFKGKHSGELFIGAQRCGEPEVANHWSFPEGPARKLRKSPVLTSHRDERKLR